VYVFDTDIVVHLQEGHKGLTAKVESSEWEIYTTIVTKAEVLRGRTDFLLKAANSGQLLRSQQWLVDSEKQLSNLAILMVTQGAIEQLAKLQGQRGLGRVGRADLIIASIVLAHNATLVTRNTKDFVRIPNLKLENWLDS
jgi:tRNA(fMet)-specific endonuclease VapC